MIIKSHNVIMNESNQSYTKLQVTKNVVFWLHSNRASKRMGLLDFVVGLGPCLRRLLPCAVTCLEARLARIDHLVKWQSRSKKHCWKHCLDLLGSLPEWKCQECRANQSSKSEVWKKTVLSWHALSTLNLFAHCNSKINQSHQATTWAKWSFRYKVQPLLRCLCSLFCPSQPSPPIAPRDLSSANRSRWCSFWSSVRTNFPASTWSKPATGNENCIGKKLQSKAKVQRLWHSVSFCHFPPGWEPNHCSNTVTTSPSHPEKQS